MSTPTSKSRVVVLFSSAGRRVELINCFRDDARDLGITLEVVAVDACPEMSSACWAADRRYPVPRCIETTFIPRLLEICRSEKVDLLVPTIDPELETLALHRDRFASVGTRVVVSSLDVVQLARNKARTAATLRKHGIRTPTTFPLGELLSSPSSLRWPIVVKPIAGSSSTGFFVARHPEEVRQRSVNEDTYVAQEFLEGREYTVNLFFDCAGTLRCAVPHRRCEIRAGEVSKGVTERHSGLLDAAARMERALPGACGPLCCQAMVDADNVATIFEINARFGGGFPLAHRAGARFSKWLLEEAVGLPASANDQWQANVAMLRYDAAIFTTLCSQA